MEFSEESSESESKGVSVAKTKKRPVTGRVQDASKKLKVKGHATGDNCNCSRFACFDNISLDKRNQKFNQIKIIQKFNEYDTYNDQNSYLRGYLP